MLARAVAIANQVFVVNLNAAAPTATGQSLVVDPEAPCCAGGRGARVADARARPLHRRSRAPEMSTGDEDEDVADSAPKQAAAAVAPS